MIRKATIADLDAIWQLRLKTTKLLKLRGIDQWQFDQPNKKRFEWDILNQSFFVYIIEEQIVAMMYIQHENEDTYDEIKGNWRDDQPYITIHRLAVDTSYLGKGIAHKMLDFAKSYAKNHHIYSIRIDTHKNNQYAIKLFLNQGFIYRGEIDLKSKYGDPMRLAYDILLGEHI